MSMFALSARNAGQDVASRCAVCAPAVASVSSRRESSRGAEKTVCVSDRRSLRSSRPGRVEECTVCGRYADSLGREVDEEDSGGYELDEPEDMIYGMMSQISALSHPTAANLIPTQPRGSVARPSDSQCNRALLVPSMVVTAAFNPAVIGSGARKGA